MCNRTRGITKGKDKWEMRKIPKGRRKGDMGMRELQKERKIGNATGNKKKCK